jgi:hypothetical protein
MQREELEQLGFDVDGPDVIGADGHFHVRKLLRQPAAVTTSQRDIELEVRTEHALRQGRSFGRWLFRLEV